MSNGVPQVVAEIFEETDAPSIPVLLLDLVESAHLQPCSPQRFVVRQAVRDVAVYQSFKMKTELVVQVLFYGTASDERPKPVREIGEHRCLRLHAFQNVRDDIAQLAPSPDLRLQVGTAALGQLVVLRAPIVV